MAFDFAALAKNAAPQNYDLTNGGAGADYSAFIRQNAIGSVDNAKVNDITQQFYDKGYAHYQVGSSFAKAFIASPNITQAQYANLVHDYTAEHTPTVADRLMDTAMPVAVAAIFGAAGLQAIGASAAAGSASAQTATSAISGVKSAAGVAGTVGGLAKAVTTPQTPSTGLIKMADSTTTQLPGNTPTDGTAQLPGQPIIITTAPATTQAQQSAFPQNNTLLYVGIGAILYLLIKRRG